MRYRNLLYGIVAIFFYVGGEVSIGSLLISFLKLENIAGLSDAQGSTYVSYYWGGLMIGRFLGAISLSNLRSSFTKHLLMIAVPITAFLVIWYVSGIQVASIYSIFLVLNFFAFLFGKSLPNRTLYIFAFAAIGLLITALFSDGRTAMWSIIGIGLFNSIMWSNIFTLAIEGLGKYKSQGSSLLVMAILGGALIPVLQGYFADVFGLHASFFVPVFCHLYIAFYGIYGYKRDVKSVIVIK